ncbi:MAG TPA: exodeoxyribonuclease III [Sandaracinaceae bacterium LLY-WYZ-13_1]|nr:exodeoxyribonuclease III [Sandaracinaceae bacterium LLY-WYZ-13_1]
MRICSWNVNGVRAIARKGFGAWLDGCGADLVGLQETRCLPEQVPEAVRDRPRFAHQHWVSAERRGYSGVGLLSRHPIDDVQTSLGVGTMDREGRVQIARIGRLTVVNCYFPNGNGKDRDNGRVPFKLRFYRRLYRVLDEAKQRGEPIVVMGDFNTAPEPIDLARPRQNRKTSGFLPEERRELKRWLKNGWVDTFRAFEPGPDHYSWWSQRKGVRARNVGWRIDLALASPGAAPHLRAAALHPDVLGSDHCPISVELDDAVLGRVDHAGLAT